ncbi:MAG: type I-C CRISPR-associated protein Cas8c/Csd1 [Peptococcaceae bacterium]|nr:type I-C CRISPR-associated protein Cas8c/Csd1 [Peptococcaceae bacterium]
MILQALKDYYDRQAASTKGEEVAPFGWEHKEISYVFVLATDGTLSHIDDMREGEGKKLRGKRMLVPEGAKKTSGIVANLLWDVAGYVFGVVAPEGRSDDKNVARAKECQQAFLDRLVKELPDLPAVEAVVTFLTNMTPDCLRADPHWETIETTNPVVSFRIVGDMQLVCRRPEVVARIDGVAMEATVCQEATCLVTGQKGPIKTLHRAIKGVYGAQSSGANIVSFNLSAFESFGKEQGLNAPVGSIAEFAYTTALNTLLGRESKQRLSIGDASTVFWSASGSKFEQDFASFFAEPSKDDPDAQTSRVSALFQSVHSGAYLSDESSNKFFILGLSPNAGRISVRFWQVGSIGEVATRIRQYFDDFAIVKPPNEPQYYSLWRILVNVATQDKSENIPPNLAGDFMRAIIGGTPYPAILLQAALRRIKSDIEHRVKPVRAALIKAYLNRYHRFHPESNHKEVTMHLDVNQPSLGYQIGRLFAVLEKIQEEANPGINATIRERYYGAASTTPVTVFSRLLQLKNHHLAKLSNRGRVVNFERLLGEIMIHVTDFPSHLDLNEQGRFAIGYYHQRQAFFTKKELKDEQELLLNDSADIK